MNPDQVFQKTDKGREEIAKRTYRLDARRRMLLILVDGQSSAESLAAKVAHVEGSETFLQSLWTEGFIEPVGEALATAPAVGAAPAHAPRRTPSRSSSSSERRAPQIERLMGPDGDTLALKIEKAATREAVPRRSAQGRATPSRPSSGPRKAELFAKVDRPLAPGPGPPRPPRKIKGLPQ